MATAAQLKGIAMAKTAFRKKTTSLATMTTADTDAAAADSPDIDGGKFHTLSIHFRGSLRQSLQVDDCRTNICICDYSLSIIICIKN